MGLTEGLTFMIFLFAVFVPVDPRGAGPRHPESGRYFSTGLAVAVHDATARQVVGRQLYNHTVFGNDADVVLPHLA